MKKKLINMVSVLLAFLIVMSAVPAFVFAGEKTETVTVYLSMSHDDKFLYCEDSETVMAMKKVEVPYFDLALYGLEDYYFKSEDYAEGDTSHGSSQTADDKPTLLHLYLYATEVFYLGLEESKAGKGYLKEEGILGTETITVTGAPGSLYLPQFWGGDENFNYYVNHNYPLASSGWGATADQILIEDGDVITLGHFTDWSFYSDPASVFNYIKSGENTSKITATIGDKIPLTLLNSGQGSNYQTSHDAITSSPKVYYTPADEVTADVTEWTEAGTAKADGTYEFDTSSLKAGDYLIGITGSYGETYTESIVATPGAIHLTVNDLPNNAPVFAEGIRADGGTRDILLGSSFDIDLSEVFIDSDGDELTYTVSVNGEKAVNTEEKYTYSPEAPGNTTLAFMASDGKDGSEIYTVNLKTSELMPVEIVFEKDVYRENATVKAEVYIVGNSVFNAAGYSIVFDTKNAVFISAEEPKDMSVAKLYNDADNGALARSIYVDAEKVVSPENGRTLIDTITFKMIFDGAIDAEFATIEEDADFADESTFVVYNGEYYPTEGRITYLRSADLEAEKLADAKSDAVTELEGYKNAEDYREAQKAELAEAIEAGKKAINDAETVEEVKKALDNAKKALDAIKTDAELTAEEAEKTLAEVKLNAKQELATYKDPDDYRQAQKSELADAVEAGKNAIEAAGTVADVLKALNDAKATIDKIKTDAQLKAEESDHEHVYGEWTVVKEASCTASGMEKRTCTCGKDETRTIEKLAHKEEILKAVEANCTSSGLTEGKKCSVCGTVTVKQEAIAALGHKEEVIQGKAATCTEAGLTEGKKCTVCGTVTVSQEVIAALGHKEEVIQGKAATCTESGLTEGKKCTVCGTVTVKQEEIAALGHKEEIIPGKPATETETGLTEGKKCSVCGEIIVKQEEIPVLEKEYVLGDVNGDGKVNALDATQILRYANNKASVLSGVEEDTALYKAADVNADGKINALDATQILRYANNKASVFDK
ncbi:MAG: hypothetical protein IKM61_02555 [Eubacteriaceae bacterium]|nr:hypothetical protein [Eubacteriaceae bacterium]